MDKMSKHITLKQLQEVIKETDYNPSLKDAYFYKLVEEVGELGNVLRKNNFMDIPSSHSVTNEVKGSIEEELYDVLHYVAAIANLHEIDLEECVRLKREFNSKRKRTS
ncbi:MAG: MazG nucleotide pyrophosphohydrolase domain-containing protein [Spirochaetales bacterium]|nr:MazG nucleotide pyrophosphohydrolase domain-containing protein [Spirochaetales bacterium]